MPKGKQVVILSILGMLAAACRFGAAAPATPSPTPAPLFSETPTQPLATATLLSTTPPEATPAPASTATPQALPTSGQQPTEAAPTTAPPAETGEEAILILEPGPGGRVTNPIQVAGQAGPTFEQALLVRVLQDDGTELAQAPVTIQAEVGQRGAFQAELNLDLNEERNLFIQVLSHSPRDGGVTHLAAVGVIFTPTGPADSAPQAPQPERITITRPQPGETLPGGQVQVEGVGLASFEQSLLVEVLDTDGNVCASQPVTVQAPDLGQPGPFSATLSCPVTAAGPGRVVVRDLSPAFGGDTHLSSVEVNLEP